MIVNNHVIFIPGLNDHNPINIKLIGLLPFIWRHYFIVHVVYPNWGDGKSFFLKLEKVTKKIDSLLAKGFKVTLIGQSAGGSLAINALSQRKKFLLGAVNITGRLQEGLCLRPSLKWAGRKSPAFIQSVLYCEKKAIPSLTKSDRKRILTIRPILDEIVPSETVPIEDATNVVSPFPGHLSGILICAFYKEKIFRFINNIYIP